jgi:hypothetical protein
VGRGNRRIGWWRGFRRGRFLHDVLILFSEFYFGEFDGSRFRIKSDVRRIVP